jgi:peptide deformylase
MTDVLAHPNPSLKMRSEEVDPANEPDLRALCKRMAKAMYDAPGIGLAAPQIGVMKRVIVFDLGEESGTGLVAICNPVIVESSGECESDEEGCLSLPGITVPIERACKITCEAETLDGKHVRIEAEDLLARMLQHEIDHLDGKLIIDRAEPEERKAALRRYLEVQQGTRPPHVSEEL